MMQFSDRWVRRFFDISSAISTWSKDYSTKCGAVIVRPDKTICSVGYNGFPRGVDDNSVTYDEKNYMTVHAEINAILSARDQTMAGYSLFLVAGGLSPCSQCAAAIIQKGIKHVYVLDNGKNEDIDYITRKAKWSTSCNKGLSMFEECGVEVHIVKVI